MSNPTLTRHDAGTPNPNHFSAAQGSTAEMTSVQIAPLSNTHQKSLKRDSKSSPTDDKAIVPNRGGQKKLEKRSWEYVVKSGVAGGMAGCAVRHLFVTAMRER